MKKVGVIAGSFDPITEGHLGLIAQAMSVVDHLHVVVGHNPAKKYMFTPQERLDLTKDVLFNEWCDAYLRRMTVVLGEDELLVRYAERVNAKFLIRGIRNTADYTYEAEMEAINKDINSEIETLFFMPPRGMSQISSSTVKGLVGFKGSESTINKYVPDEVFLAMLNKREGKPYVTTTDWKLYEL